MKVLVGAAVSALLLAGVAFAQTDTTTTAPTPPATPLPTQCTAIGPAPTIPDGARATASQMHASDQSYRAWATDTDARLHCRALEIETANRQVQAALAAWNADKANAQAASNAYNASVTAFNARGAQGRVQQQQHGGLVSTHE